MNKIDYKKQGKKNLSKGRRFELLVRKDLESKGWIVGRWCNNLDYPKENINKPPEKRGDYKLIPAKQGRFRKTSTGFPDFICYRVCDGGPEYGHDFDNIYVDSNFYIIFVECKSNGYLSKEEKSKAKWYLENNYCSEFLIASKGTKKGEIIYKECD
jgi:hypothetical protein